MLRLSTVNEFTVMESPHSPHLFLFWKNSEARALFSKFDIREGIKHRIGREDTYKRDSKPNKDFPNGS